MMPRIPFVVVVALLAALPAMAGEPSSQGSRVRVKAAGEVADDGTVTAGKRQPWIVGTLLAIDAEYLTVATADRQERLRVPRWAVTDMELSSGRSRGRGALIGLGVGVAIGLVWGANEYNRCEAQGMWFCETAYVAGPVMMGGCGTLLGLAVGTERWTKVSPARFELGVVPAAGGVRVAGTVRF